MLAYYDWRYDAHHANGGQNQRKPTSWGRFPADPIEPVAVFTGEAVHAYLGHLPDGDIEAMLNELAIEGTGRNGST